MPLDFSHQDVEYALNAGLDYLARTQMPSGEFQTVVGPQPNLVESIPFTTSPYITTYIAHALSHLSDTHPLLAVRSRMANYLESEEELDGTWNYQGRGIWRIPADLDTTVCAAAALIVLGRREPASFYRLLFRVVRQTGGAYGGPYYTYIGVNQSPDDPFVAPFHRELDVMVNLNVAFLCGLLGVAVPGATDFVLQHLQQGAFADQNRYYISPHFQMYTLTRAYADGEVLALEPAVPALLERLGAELRSPVTVQSAFNLACVATSLINLGRVAASTPWIQALLEMQEPDGGWPIGAAGGGFPREWDWDWLERWPDGPALPDRGWCWGSRAMVTAFALESCAKWQARHAASIISPDSTS